MREKYYDFLEWKTRSLRRFAFWLMGWKNIHELKVVYHPDEYTKTTVYRNQYDGYSTIYDVKIPNNEY